MSDFVFIYDLFIYSIYFHNKQNKNQPCQSELRLVRVCNLVLCILLVTSFHRHDERICCEDKLVVCSLSWWVISSRTSSSAAHQLRSSIISIPASAPSSKFSGFAYRTQKKLRIMYTSTFVP